MRFIDMTTGLMKVVLEHRLDHIDLLILHHVYLANMDRKEIYLMDIPKLFDWVSLDAMRRRIKRLAREDYLDLNGAEDGRRKEVSIGKKGIDVIKLVERADVY